MKTVAVFVSRNPWIYVVLAFALLLAAWSTLISIAVKHSPQQIQAVEVKR